LALQIHLQSEKTIGSANSFAVILKIVLVQYLAQALTVNVSTSPDRSAGNTYNFMSVYYTNSIII
jgi:hypothetical protein